MIDDERFSQAAIDRLTPIEPSADLRRMVAQIPIEHAHAAQPWWPFSSLWLPTFSMAAVALLGLFLGRAWQESQAEASKSHVAELATPDASFEDNLAALEQTESETAATELDDLLLLATAGDFSADDWDLSRVPEAETSIEETF